MDLLEWRSRVLNRLFTHRHFDASAIACMLRTDTEISIVEIPRLCLEVGGISRTKIVQIGAAFAKDEKDYFKFGAAFRECFSGMNEQGVERIFKKHINPMYRQAALKGAAAWEAA